MDNLIGKKLDGRYLIESLIGVGGMANVYKGRDVRTGNQIAVKVLKEEFLDNEELVRRFKNESKSISILNHPNIVKVYDVSVTDQLDVYKRQVSLLPKYRGSAPIQWAVLNGDTETGVTIMQLLSLIHISAADVDGIFQSVCPQFCGKTVGQTAPAAQKVPSGPPP